ncbi:MAG: MFS transporter [Acidimicrobiia bacterium]|nr:MFS transporter [Acidimicrobiia bacterium]
MTNDPTRRTASVRTLFALRDFRNYWYGSATFGLGIWAFITAIGWTALELTDSAFAVSLVNVVYFLPMFLFALPAGVLADVADRRRTAIASRAAGGVVAMILAFLAGTGDLTFAWLLVLSFLVGVSIISEMASRQAYVAQIVAPAQLTNAMALSAFQGGVARVAGPLLAGWLIGRFGDAGGYGLFAATNFAFVWFFMRIRTPAKATQRDGRRLVADLADGFRYLGQNREARAVVVISILSGAVGWVYLALMPIMARDVLDGGAVLLGVLGMAVGVGSVPSSLYLSVRTRVGGEGRLFVSALITWALGIIVFGVTASVPLAVVALFASGLGFGVQSVLAQTLLLRLVEPEFHGRVLGLLALTWGANIVGTLTAGSLADMLGVGVVVAASGVIIIAVTVTTVARNPRLLAA